MNHRTGKAIDTDKIPKYFWELLLRAGIEERD